MVERVDGRSRKLSARTDHPLTAPLRQLVLAAHGPPAIVADELKSIDGIDDQYIFGSWAARYAGEPGRFPNDVDVLVIGSPKRSAVPEATAAAAARLNIEVNATIMSPQRWNSPDDPLVADIKSRPAVHLEIERPAKVTATAHPATIIIGDPQ